jgi:hypothetical protein
VSVSAWVTFDGDCNFNCIKIRVEVHWVTSLEFAWLRSKTF